MLLGWLEKGGQKEKEIGFHEGLRFEGCDLLRWKVVEIGVLRSFE